MRVVLNVRKPMQQCKVPAAAEKRITQAIQERSLGLMMHYSGAAANTEPSPEKRVFPAFALDRSRVIEPTAVLNRMGVPVAMLSGNMPGYLRGLCTSGYRAWLNDRGWLASMSKFRLYHKEATAIDAFNKDGERISGISTAYAGQYRIPVDHVTAIRSALEQADKAVIQNKPMAPFVIKARPHERTGEDDREISYVYGRTFQDRGGQAALIAVPGEYREQMISFALDKLEPSITRLYRFEPGGEASINIMPRAVTRNSAAEHFIKDMGLSLLLYFGGSAHKKEVKNGRRYEGKDIPVARNENAVLFAMDRNQGLVQKDPSRIIPAGPGPDSTREWLVWLVSKYASVLFAADNVPKAQKIVALNAIATGDLVEEIEVA